MRHRQVEATGRCILVIDDDEQVVQSTTRLLEREGHEVIAAHGGQEGLDILRSRRVDLVLVDYFMPGMTGEDFVQKLRVFDRHVQVILQTGYATERPPRAMLRRLDIQGYHDKSEGPEKLGLWVDVGLRAAFTVQLLEKSRAGLAYILDATPELHKIQPLEQLLQGILTQTGGLLGVTDSLLAVSAQPVDSRGQDAFVAMAQAGGALRIRAATGRFAGCTSLASAFTAEQLVGLSSAVAHERVHTAAGGTVVALRLADATLGFIFLQGKVDVARERELLAIFANQAAVAIQNASLYELAAVDQLTRTYTRRFFDQALAREIRLAYRTGAPVSLLMVDIDDMKRINDGGGHLAGDQALALVGSVLRKTTRLTDMIGRFGGDEFAILLPNTPAVGAEIVARRIADAASVLTVDAGAERYDVRVTVGAGTLTASDARRLSMTESFFDVATRRLLAAADGALYVGKGAGKSQCGGVRPERWPHSVAPPPERVSKMPAP